MVNSTQYEEEEIEEDEEQDKSSREEEEKIRLVNLTDEALGLDSSSNAIIESLRQRHIAEIIEFQKNEEQDGWQLRDKMQNLTSHQVSYDQPDVLGYREDQKHYQKVALASMAVLTFARRVDANSKKPHKKEDNSPDAEKAKAGNKKVAAKNMPAAKAGQKKKPEQMDAADMMEMIQNPQKQKESLDLVRSPAFQTMLLKNINALPSLQKQITTLFAAQYLLKDSGNFTNKAAVLLEQQSKNTSLSVEDRTLASTAKEAIQDPAFVRQVAVGINAQSLNGSSLGSLVGNVMSHAGNMSIGNKAGNMLDKDMRGIDPETKKALLETLDNTGGGQAMAPDAKKKLLAEQAVKAGGTSATKEQAATYTKDARQDLVKDLFKDNANGVQTKPQKVAQPQPEMAYAGAAPDPKKSPYYIEAPSLDLNMKLPWERSN